MIEVALTALHRRECPTHGEHLGARCSSCCASGIPQAATTSPSIHLRPEPEFPLTGIDAARLASWYCRYALDQLGDDERIYHPNVRTFLISAKVQHDAVERMLDPVNDQVDPSGVRRRQSLRGSSASLTTEPAPATP